MLLWENLTGIKMEKEKHKVRRMWKV